MQIAAEMPPRYGNQQSPDLVCEYGRYQKE